MKEQILYVNRLIGIQDHLYPNFSAKISIECIKKVHYYTIEIFSEKYNIAPIKLIINDSMNNDEVMSAIETLRLNLKMKKILKHSERRRIPKREYSSKYSGTENSK